MLKVCRHWLVPVVHAKSNGVTMAVTILNGDVRKVLPTLEDNSVDCIVTSPPYWGLRDYGNADQIGLEPTMHEYLDTMVSVCRELRRVLKPDGTFWLNIGDSYAANRGGSTPPPETIASGDKMRGRKDGYNPSRDPKGHGLKHKDLCMIPNRLAILLQEDGWYVRSEIIWHKPNPMPESVRDRPTNSHEKVWLLTKSEKYYYDADSIREAPSESLLKQIKEGYEGNGTKDYKSANVQNPSDTKKRIIENARKKLEAGLPIGANAKNVWTITTKSFKGAHFATMPVDLAERCILAGCPVGGTVLDPFGGAGTTGFAANLNGRNATLIELNNEYVSIAESRITPNLLEHFEVKDEQTNDGPRFVATG